MHSVQRKCCTQKPFSRFLKEGLKANTVRNFVSAYLYFIRYSINCCCFILIRKYSETLLLWFNIDTKFQTSRGWLLHLPNYAEVKRECLHVTYGLIRTILCKQLPFSYHTLIITIFFSFRKWQDLYLYAQVTRASARFPAVLLVHMK